MRSEGRKEIEVEALLVQFKAKREMPLSDLIAGVMNKTDEFSISWYLSQADKKEREVCIQYIQEQFQQEGVILTSQSHFLLALSYLYQYPDCSIKENLNQWLGHLQKAANQYCLEAKSILAISYYLPCEPLTALTLLEEAAGEKSLTALYMLGLLYEPLITKVNFKEIEKNPLKAQYYFNAAARVGHPDALMLLANQIYDRDTNLAFEFALCAIQEGNHEGFFLLGQILRDSDHNYLAAIQMLKCAAEASSEEQGNVLHAIFATIVMEEDIDKKAFLFRQLLKTTSESLRMKLESILFIYEVYWTCSNFLPLLYLAATELPWPKRECPAAILSHSSLDQLEPLFRSSPSSTGDLRFRRQFINKIDSVFRGLLLKGLSPEIIIYILKPLYGEKLVEAIHRQELFTEELAEERGAYSTTFILEKMLSTQSFKSKQDQNRKAKYLTTLNEANTGVISYVEAVTTCRAIQEEKDNQPSKKRRLSR